MSEGSHGHGGSGWAAYGGKPRGPYGTNEGDVWLLSDYFQDRIKAENGPSWRMVAEMLVKDGKLQECYYTTEDPELVTRADRGHEHYVAAQAANN
jgi:hypothetical protein